MIRLVSFVNARYNVVRTRFISYRIAFIPARRIYRPCFLVPQRSEKADGLGKPYDSRLATKLTVRCRRVRRSRNRTVEVWAKRGVVFIANAISHIFSLISKKRARFVRFGEAE